jgi:hypothetical protein
MPGFFSSLFSFITKSYLCITEKNRVSLTVSDSTLASVFGLLEKWGGAHTQSVDETLVHCIISAQLNIGTLDAAASDDVTRFHDSVDLEGFITYMYTHAYIVIEL